MVMNNSKYLYWMQPIAGVDIVPSNLQSSSKTISLPTVKYEAICDIIHQMSTVLSTIKHYSPFSDMLLPMSPLPFAL